jgi:hypothetical protein
VRIGGSVTLDDLSDFVINLYERWPLPGVRACGRGVTIVCDETGIHCLDPRCGKRPNRQIESYKSHARVAATAPGYAALVRGGCIDRRVCGAGICELPRPVMSLLALLPNSFVGLSVIEFALS